MLDFLFIIIAVAAGGGTADKANPVEVVAARQSTVVIGSNVTVGGSDTVLIEGQVAEPQIPIGKFTTATEIKPIMTATKQSWVGVREWEGQDLVYVTHLWSWRCGMVEVKIAINGGPAEIWPLPECHMDHAAPNAILDGDGLPFRAFPLKSVEFVAVYITYDDLSTDEAAFTRNSILIP